MSPAVPIEHSLDGNLAIVAPDLPSALASPAVLRRVRAIARTLPPASLSGLECRLDGRGAPVDLAARWEPQLVVGVAGGRDDAGWRRIGRLAAGLGEPDMAGVGPLWLAFDVDELSDPDPLPSAYFFLPEDAHRATAVLNAGMELLGYAGWPTARPRVQRCFDRLPRGARVQYAGAMLGRDRDGIRLTVGGIDPPGLPSYLDEIGWPGCPEGFAALVDTAHCADPVLVLDVGARIGPRVGLECCFRGAVASAGWRALLDRLVTQGACTPACRDGVLAWPGVVRRGGCGVPWPPGLSDAASLLGQRGEYALARLITHVKVSHSPEHGLDAKAYLGIRPRWDTSIPAAPQTSCRAAMLANGPPAVISAA